jgi:hypothetical protein
LRQQSAQQPEVPPVARISAATPSASASRSSDNATPAGIHPPSTERTSAEAGTRNSWTNPIREYNRAYRDSRRSSPGIPTRTTPTHMSGSSPVAL